MTYTLTILGCGVMGQAVLSAIYKAPKATSVIKALYPSKIITCNHDEPSAQQVTDLISTFETSPNGIEVVSTYGKNVEAVKQSDVIILGTKPFLAEQVLNGVKDVISGKLIISLAAGWTIGQLQAYTPSVSRVMTNTPAKYGYGCAVVSHSPQVTEDQK